MTSSNPDGEDEAKKFSNGDEKKEDAELEALLDSAYEELVKVETTKDVSSQQQGLENDSKTDEKEAASSKKPAPSSSQEGERNLDDFLSTMEAEFRRLITAEDPNALSDIERLTQELEKAAREDTPAGGSTSDFASLFGSSATNLESLLSSMGSGGSEGANEDPSASVMGALLSQLLSHDLLYPAVVQLRDRYPGWLEKNQASPDFERCSRQYEVVKRLCQTYEQQAAKEGQNSSQPQNLTAILSIVHELQACGDPPAELLEPGEIDGSAQNKQSATTTGHQSSSENSGDDCKVQ